MSRTASSRQRTKARLSVLSPGRFHSLTTFRQTSSSTRILTRRLFVSGMFGIVMFLFCDVLFGHCGFTRTIIPKGSPTCQRGVFIFFGMSATHRRREQRHKRSEESDMSVLREPAHLVADDDGQARQHIASLLHDTCSIPNLRRRFRCNCNVQPNAREHSENMVYFAREKEISLICPKRKAVAGVCC